MYTAINTVELDKIPSAGNAKLSYFQNRITGDIYAESKTLNGFEYYLATPEQMRVCMCGEYLGFKRHEAETGAEANILPHNPETHHPRTLSLDSETFG